MSEVGSNLSDVPWFYVLYGGVYGWGNDAMGKCWIYLRIEVIIVGIWKLVMKAGYESWIGVK